MWGRDTDVACPCFFSWWGVHRDRSVAIVDFSAREGKAPAWDLSTTLRARGGRSRGVEDLSSGRSEDRPLQTREKVKRAG